MFKYFKTARFSILLLAFLFLLGGTNDIYQLVSRLDGYTPPEGGLSIFDVSSAGDVDYIHIKHASQGVLFITFGLFFGGSFIVGQLWKHRQETSLKVLLGWCFLMFRVWLLVSGITFILAGKLLFQPINETVYGVCNQIFGCLCLGLLVVTELFVWLLRKMNKRKQIGQNES